MLKQLLLVTIGFLTTASLVAQDDCQFRTQTPGGWGAPANGNNPGMYRDMHFDEAFPDGLTVGCEENSLTLTSAAAVQNYLPCGGPAAILSDSYTDPDCLGNVFSGHLVALTLSVGFDYNDPDFGDTETSLGDGIINDGMFAGMTVNELLQIANDVFGGCSDAYTANQVKGAIAAINEGYVDGEFNSGILDCEEEECPDTEAPVVVYCPDDLTYSCDEEIGKLPMPTFEDESDFEVTVMTSTEEGDCGSTTTYMYTATDECGNSSSCFYDVIIVDDEAPMLNGVPDNMMLECGAEVPEPPMVTAEDACGSDVTLTFEESIGEVNEDGSCTLSLPLNDGYYDEDWALILLNFDLDYIFYHLIEGSWTEDGEGNALIEASFVSTANPNAGWNATVILQNGLNWEEWSNQEFPTSYKDDFDFAGDNYLDWIYYIISSEGSTLTGWGDFEGSFLQLSHAPSNYYYGYQVGIAANNVNENYGSGGWFNYNGTFIDASSDYEAEVEGAGDFAFEHACCDDPTITWTWTASDACGNSVSASTVITFGTVGGGMAPQIDSSNLAICAADITGNGMVDTGDFLAVLSAIGTDTSDNRDLNGDGRVDTTDILSIFSVYGMICE